MKRWDGLERRRFVRSKFPCKITLSKPNEQVIDTRVENIGSGGIMVVLEQRLKLAALVAAQIFIGSKIINCEGKVIWVVEKPNPYSEQEPFYDIGIEFHRISETDRLIVENFVRECNNFDCSQNKEV